MHLDTIIVEDEPLSRQYLASLLEQFCPAVNLVSSVPAEEDAVKAIMEKRPHLVFLDIELTMGSGFDVLGRVREIPFHVVFTTALDHHALNLIKLSGTDYLQKPIDIDELTAMVEKAAVMQQRGERQAGIAYLLESLDGDHTPVHVVLNEQEQNGYIKLQEIVRIEAVEHNTKLSLADGSIRATSRALKEWEDLLNSYGFFRVHQHHLINIRQAGAGIDGDEIKMKDGSIVPVSPKRREELSKVVGTRDDR